MYNPVLYGIIFKLSVDNLKFKLSVDNYITFKKKN